MTKDEKNWLDDTASLGCVVCRNLGFGPSHAEIHHIRDGQGVSQRAEHHQTLPLCPRHHRACYPTGFHAASASWQQEHGTEQQLLEQVRSEVLELRSNRIGGAA